MTYEQTAVPVHLAADYKVLTYKNSDGGDTIQCLVPFVLVGGVPTPVGDTNPLPIDGSISVSLGGMPTLTKGSKVLTTGVSAEVMPANASRVAGGFIINPSPFDVWLEIGAAAVVAECIPLRAGQRFEVTTEQQIRGIQDSGGDLTLYYYEAT